MKNFFSLPLFLGFFLVGSAGCEKKLVQDGVCNQITLNKPFIGQMDEQWCLEEGNWKIRFGPFIEDSRCNVTGIECVWAGRYVMATTIEKGNSTQDTFYAVNNWSDTLYYDGYSIILKKIFPEIRTSMEPLDTSKYSFEVLVK
jgi:hypothetical protein